MATKDIADRYGTNVKSVRKLVREHGVKRQWAALALPTLAVPSSSDRASPLPPRWPTDLVSGLAKVGKIGAAGSFTELGDMVGLLLIRRPTLAPVAKPD